MSELLASCRDVVVEYGTSEASVKALDGVDLDVHAGERVALRGRSGSGKTTLLHVLGKLVEPSRGAVELHSDKVAFVFQSSNLLPTFTAYENVSFAARAAVAENGSADVDPLALLQLVGLDAKAENLPGELSGGEAQRVAIARALAQRPALLLCDEPTGQLDRDTGTRVLDLLDALQREFGFALVTATHDEEVAGRLDRIVELEDGRIVGHPVRT
jgi:putative ABC transport system ATP-binding protein